MQVPLSFERENKKEKKKKQDQRVGFSWAGFQLHQLKIKNPKN